MSNNRANQPVPIYLTLPENVVEKVDKKGSQCQLKRGPMVRLYLSQGLEDLEKNNNIHELLNSWKCEQELITVSLQITQDMNNQLMDIVKKLPISKKRLSELIVALTVSKEML